MSNQVAKRKRAIPDYEMYNGGGYYLGDFSSFISKHIIYPEIKNTGINCFYVPVLYRITEDGALFDLAIKEEDESGNVNLRYQLATETAFEKEAIRLVSLLEKWKPFCYKGTYVNREGVISIPFEYHKEYFKSLSNDFVLNPDVKPIYNGDPNLYNRFIHPKNGCDGMVTFLAIIEKDGSMSHEVCLGADGKTNCEIGLSYLKQLIPWKPAIKNGMAVRSQVKIIIKTQ